MLARIFLGFILILTFLIIYPYFTGIWTDNVSGLNRMMANMVNLDGSLSMSPLETAIWGFFPLALLLIGVGGFAWLMFRDRER
jgi:hypothetical protein